MNRYYRVALFALVTAGIISVSPGRTQERRRAADQKKPAATAAVPPIIAPEYIPIEGPVAVKEMEEFNPITYTPPSTDITVETSYEPPADENPDLIPNYPNCVVIGTDGYWYECGIGPAGSKNVRGKRIALKTRTLERGGVKVKFKVKDPGGKVWTFNLGVAKRSF